MTTNNNTFLTEEWFTTDIQRLKEFGEAASQEPIDLDLTTDEGLSNLFYGLGYTIGIKLAKDYQVSQPNLDLQDLDPFIIFHEAVKELDTICSVKGVSEHTKWIVLQAAFKRGVLVGCILWYDNTREIDTAALHSTVSLTVGDLLKYVTVPTELPN